VGERERNRNGDEHMTVRIKTTLDRNGP